MTDINQTMISEMPESTVSEENFVTEDSQTPLDRYGRSFDPETHVVDDQGSPLLTKAGFLRVKRGKGLKQSSVGKPDHATGEGQSQACGITTAELIFVMGVVIGGEDWLPENHERLYMQDAWSQYFEKKGIQDLPPGILIATAMVSYVVPRLTKPTTQTRLGKAWRWVKNRFRKRSEEKEHERMEVE